MSRLRFTNDETKRYQDDDDWIDLKSELSCRQERERQRIHSKMFQLTPEAVQAIASGETVKPGAIQVDYENSNNVVDELNQFDFEHYVMAWSLGDGKPSQDDLDRIPTEGYEWVMAKIAEHRAATIPSAGDLKNSPDSSATISEDSTPENAPPHSQTKANPANATPGSDGKAQSAKSSSAASTTASPTPVA